MTYRDLFQCDDCDDHEPCEFHTTLADRYAEPDEDRQYKEQRDADL